MKNQDIARFLYEQRIKSETPSSNPQGEEKALLEMYDEINQLGYDYHYLADLELRSVKDPRIMKLFWKYLPRMESISTIQSIIKRINSKVVPDVTEYAMNIFLNFSPSDKLYLLEFDDVISKGQKSDAYFGKISNLLSDGDSYAVLRKTRGVLGKNRPETLLPFIKLYRSGVLLPIAIRDCVYYNDAETIDFLNHCLNITEEEIREIRGNYNYKSNNYKYQLSVTAFEYWDKICTKDYISNEAKQVLKKIK